jgi:hypothetical protein
MWRWSMRGSMPPICPVSGLPARTLGLRRGPRVQRRVPVSGCTWKSMPPSPSTIPTTSQDAAETWKRTWGHHPLLVFLDRPEIAGGEALAGLLRPGNAGSNTAADHVTLESLPAAYRPNPNDPGGPQILGRRDTAGATHTFAGARRAAVVGFSLGYAGDARVRDAVEILNTNDGWYPRSTPATTSVTAPVSPRPPDWSR